MSLTALVRSLVPTTLLILAGVSLLNCTPEDPCDDGFGRAADGNCYPISGMTDDDDASHGDDDDAGHGSDDDDAGHGSDDDDAGHGSDDDDAGHGSDDDDAGHGSDDDDSGGSGH